MIDILQEPLCRTVDHQTARCSSIIVTFHGLHLPWCEALYLL